MSRKYSARLIISLAVFIAVIGGLYASKYLGPKTDGALRIEALQDRIGKQEHLIDQAAPLWTSTLGWHSPTHLSPTHLRVINAGILAIVFVLWIWPIPKVTALLVASFFSLLPIWHGAVVQASYDGILALLVLTGIRWGGLWGGISAAGLSSTFLLWGTKTSSWDVVNIYAVAGKLRQPITDSGQITVVSVIVLIAALVWTYLYRERHTTDSGQHWQSWCLSGMVFLVLTLFAPGMVRGIDWLPLPFLFVACCSNRILQRPVLVLGLLLFLDAYGIQQFWYVHKTEHLSTLDGFTVPAFLGSFIGKTAILIWLADIYRRKQFAEWIDIPVLNRKALWQEFSNAWDNAARKKGAIDKRTWWLTAILTFVALVINLYDLGDRHFPISGFKNDGMAVVQIPPGVVVADIWIAQVGGTMEYNFGCGSELSTKEMGRSYALGWGYHRLDKFCQDSLTILWKKKDKNGFFSELLLGGINHKKITPTAVCDAENSCVSPEKSHLFDETADIPDIPLPSNGGTVDEMFNAGPGAGLILDVTIENTGSTSHPYLGRWLIYQSMRFFGVGPFGWRFPSAVASAFLPLLVFLLARLVLLNEWWALIAALLAFLDLLRVGTGRIAYPDSLIALSVLTHFIFMFQAFYRRGNAYLTCGLMMSAWLALGCAAAVKWSGAFPVLISLPISIVIFSDLWTKRKNRLLLVCALVGCMVLPIGIYVSTYKPFLSPTAETLTGEIIKHQSKMLRVHDGAAVKAKTLTKVKELYVGDHPSAGSVSDWLYANNGFRALMIPFFEGGPKALYLFGNPIVWWGITLSMFGFLVRDKRYLTLPVAIIVVGYFSMFLPWLVIRRFSFSYHYLGSAMMGTIIATAFLQTITHRRSRVIITIGVLFLATVSFFLFLPAITGTPLSPERIATIRWFDSWFTEMASLR